MFFDEKVISVTDFGHDVMPGLYKTIYFLNWMFTPKVP